MAGLPLSRGLRWSMAAIAALLPPCVLGGDYLGLQRYTLREGLPQLTVTALAESPEGPLWIGTQEGLARFDGQAFDVFRHQPGEPGSLVSSSVDSLAVDAAGRLWIGTNDQGVEVRDLRGGRLWRISTGDGLAHPTASQLLVYGSGALAGTPRGFDRLRIDPAGAESLTRGEEAAGLAVHAGMPYGLDRACQLWQLDPLPAVKVETGLPGEARCVALAGSPAGLWLAGPEFGLLRLDPDSGERQRWLPEALGGTESRLSALVALRSGGMLLGFEDGSLARLGDPRSARATPLRTSQRSGSRITSLYDHGSGSLWIGTYASGLLRAGAVSTALDAGPATSDGLGGWPRASVYAIWRDAATILVGTGRGLLRSAEDDAEWRSIEAIGERPVRRILPARQGGWWIGTMDGLWHLREDGSASQVQGLIDGRISDLTYRDDRLWVSTRDGLAWVEEEQASQAGIPEALRQGFLTALLIDDEGRLWVGSNENGLHVLESSGELHWLHRGNGRLSSDSVWSLHASGGFVYVGSHGGGLQRLRLNDDSGWHLGLRDGLSNNVVYRIESDSRGHLWLSSNRGLNRVDPATREVQVLRESDGLANTEYNAGASFRDAQGRLYFGGTEGLDVLDPLAVADSAGEARPLLARLQAVGRGSGLRGGGDPDWQAIALGGPLYFDWDERVLAATLVAIDFSAPDAARLRYRLLGLDPDWIEPSRPRIEILLSGLPPGEYQLEMQAAGRDGRFGAPHSVSVGIDPPPWASPQAYTLYALVGIAALAALWRRQRRLARAKQVRLEQLNQLVAQRTADLEAANRLLRQSNAQLDQAGRTDPLTGVSNRRDLHDWLEARKSAAGDASRAGGLLFCLLDLDDFKQINDSLGHRAGDQVLVAFAARLRELCREHDLVVRWGGEEFLLVLQSVREADLVGLLDRLLDQTSAPIAIGGHGTLEVGASIGVAAWPFASGHAAGEWEQSVALADRALYRAKAEGKQAWQMWSAGPALDARSLADLHAGAEPEHLAAGAVRIFRGRGQRIRRART